MHPVNVDTIDYSFACYFRILIIGERSSRVFLYLYLKAYGKTEIALLAQLTCFVFWYALTHIFIQSLQRVSKC